MSGTREAMDVRLNEDARQFEIETENGLAVLAFFRKGEKIAFVHTEVPESMEGQGIGSRLARAGLDHARDKDLRVFPFCAFVRGYVKRHPEYEDLVEEAEAW